MADAPTRAKPAYGSPCNRCGLCCMREQCPLSEVMFGHRARCPALTRDGLGGYFCGLLSSERLSPAAREAAVAAIGAGYGCDAAPEGTEDEAVAMRMRPVLRRAVDAAHASLSPAAKDVVAQWRAQLAASHG